MVLLKVETPNEINIVTRNNFIVNRILPVSIKKCNAENFYMFLFSAKQDYDDGYIYLQLCIGMENGFETDYISNHPLNIERNKDNPEKMEAYKNIISNLNDHNLYSCSLDMRLDSSHPMYYHSIAVRTIDKNHSSVLDLYIPRDNFVILSLYLNSLINCIKNKEDLFTSSLFRDIEYVNIETIKYDCTAHDWDADKIVMEKDPKRGYCYQSHYTMNCGPSEYRVNYCSRSKTSPRGLKNPLDQSLYKAFYNTDCRVSFMFFDENILCILYFVGGKKTKLLRLTKELYDKTNFVDQENIFY